LPSKSVYAASYAAVENRDEETLRDLSIPFNITRTVAQFLKFEVRLGICI